MLDTLLSRLTPVVGRLLAINAIVLLLQQTILTSPVITDLLRFDPGASFHPAVDFPDLHVRARGPSAPAR